MANALVSLLRIPNTGGLSPSVSPFGLASNCLMLDENYTLGSCPVSLKSRWCLQPR